MSRGMDEDAQQVVQTPSRAHQQLLPTSDQMHLPPWAQLIPKGIVQYTRVLTLDWLPAMPASTEIQALTSSHSKFKSMLAGYC